MTIRSFLAGVAVAVLAVTRVHGNGDLCSSDGFRDAFLDGLDSEDFTRISATLKGYGAVATPCLAAIARDGGERHGVSDCRARPQECREWAVRALGEIGGEQAAVSLVAMLKSEKSERVLLAVMGQVGALRESRARPHLQALLDATDPAVRAESVMALGAIGDKRDFDSMLRASLGLPDEQVHKGAYGVMLLRDRRAVKPLTRRAEAIKVPEVRENALRVIQKEAEHSR